MKLKRTYRAIIACLLLVSFIIRDPLQIVADTRKQYVSDIRMSWNNNSAHDAKQWLEDHGYTVIDQDLNEGTGGGYSYMGYKTTTDESEAITDLAVMDMNGGYHTSNYKTAMEQYKPQMMASAQELLDICKEYTSNYTAGSPAAQSAYHALNYFYVDEANNQPLGDYLMDSARTQGEMYHLILMCDTSVLQLIYSELCIAVGNYKTDSWLQKLSDQGPEDLDDTEYYDQAFPLLDVVKDFVTNLHKAQEQQSKKEDADPDAEIELGTSEITTENKLDEKISDMAAGDVTDESLNEDSYAMYLAAYEEMKTYPYGDGTVADLFDEEDLDVRSLYPLVKAMTPGQYGVFKLMGLCMMLMCCDSETLDFSKVSSDMQSIANGETYSVWTGVDRTVYDQEIGITKAGYREMSSVGDYESVTNDATTDREKFKFIAMKIAYYGLYVVGAALLVWAVGSLIFGAAGFFTIIGCIAVSLGHFFGVFMGITVVGYTLGIVAIVVVAVLVILFLIYWFWDDDDDDGGVDPSSVPIPLVMYDLIESENTELLFSKYEVVRDQDNNPADTNNFNGTEWNAVYYSKDKRIGSPLTVDERGGVFKTQIANGIAPAGYVGMSMFGEQTAMNTNRNARHDDRGGIYLFYHTSESLQEVEVTKEPVVTEAPQQTSKPENTPVTTGTSITAAPGQTDSPVNTPDATEAPKSTIAPENTPAPTAKPDTPTKYVREVCVESTSKEDTTKFKLENQGYTVVNVNLTRGTGSATYMGYKTTTNPEKALTDIRVALDYNQEQYGYGEATYGNCGTFGIITIFATKFACAGTPIKADFYFSDSLSGIPEGYEPINLFSGGEAFDMNLESCNFDKFSFLYFMPTETFSSGTSYISGFEFYQAYHNEYGKIANICKLKKVNVYDKEMTYSGDEVDDTYMGYTTTYNPYRASRVIKVYSAADENSGVPQNLSIGGIGYTTCPIFTFVKGFQYLQGNAYMSHMQTRGSERSNGFYVTGATTQGDLIRPSDIMLSDYQLSQAEIPEGYQPVSSLEDNYERTAVDICRGNGGGSYLYMYYKSREIEKPKYISNIVYACGDNNWDIVMYNLLGENVDEVINYNASCLSAFLGADLEDYPEKRNTIFGVNRSDSKSKAIRDIKFVFGGSGELSTKINGITYTRIGKVPMSTPWKMYAYYTRNPKAGEPIEAIDFDKGMAIVNNSITWKGGQSVILSYDTVTDEQGRTIFSKNLSFDAKSKYESFLQEGITECKAEWQMRMVRTEPVSDEKQKYLSSISVGVEDHKDHGRASSDDWWKDFALEDLSENGATRYLDFDFNYNTAKPDVFVGYSLTTKESEAITDIITTHNRSWQDSLVYNGITYYPVRGRRDLNRYTGDSDDIYMYWTKDPAAGSPITSLMGAKDSDSRSGWNIVKRIDGDCPSNMNAGADTNECDSSNACYLFFWRTDKSVDSYGSSVGSVILDHPESSVIIAMAALMIAGAGISLLFRQRKRKKEQKTV